MMFRPGERSRAAGVEVQRSASIRQLPLARTLQPNPVSLGAVSDLRACIIAISRYHEGMTKQTTVRLPEDLADDAEAVARVKGTSVNALIIDALKAEIERVRQDDDFTSRAKRLLDRDRELLERLAQ